MPVFVADEQSRPVDTDRLRRLATFVLTQQRVPQAMEVSVLCVDTEAISALNRHHMQVEGPTDVLAFPIDLPGEATAGETPILGDVVLCPEVAERQAEEHGKSAQDELDLLLVHGLLHLLGHDHAEVEEERVMFALTDRLLAGFAAQGQT